MDSSRRTPSFFQINVNFSSIPVVNSSVFNTLFYDLESMKCEICSNIRKDAFLDYGFVVCCLSLMCVSL